MTRPRLLPLASAVLAWSMTFAVSIVLAAYMSGCTTAHAHRRTMTDETGRIVTTETDLGGTIIDSDAPAKLGGLLAEGMAKAAPFLASWGGPILGSVASLLLGGGTVGTAVHLAHKSATAKRDAAYDEGAARAAPIIVQAPAVLPLPAAGAGGAGAEVGQ